MFGIGKKDRDGKQVRIEHRGNHVRASRTGGVSLRAEKKLGPVNATVNTNHGVRLSTRVARGARAALQNGKFRLIGRWQSGPLRFNLSKSGASASVKNKAGTFNVVKPQYSSFKLAGVQVRGRNAAQLQLIYMVLSLCWWALKIAFGLAVLVLWLAWLALLFVKDFITGFAKSADNQDKIPSVDKVIERSR